ncbi:hypothetical protein [Caenimonas sp. SL110]|uniref:hypothetical protein n=1 Tax=Caenimonas sp. SL110 TaxID=1450524 RepID=UPI00128AFB41|nr:hypothetical protein [Caenimonas sp. SL110]
MISTENNGTEVSANLAHDVDRFLNRVMETAIFFRDVIEIGEGGHTKAIKMLRPWNATPTAFKKLVNYQLFGERGLPLTEVAAEMVRHCPVSELPDPDVEGLVGRIRQMCSGEAQVPILVPEPTREERHSRAVWRYARYLKANFRGFVARDTRAVEWFVQRAWIPMGSATDLEGSELWNEHVVPKCAIVVEAERRFQLDPNWSVDDMAWWIEPLMAIVVIRKTDAARLDGPLRLRDSMPADWKWEKGCVFERLHKAGVKFVPPSGMSCRCEQ